MRLFATGMCFISLNNVFFNITFHMSIKVVFMMLLHPGNKRLGDKCVFLYVIHNFIT